MILCEYILNDCAGMELPEEASLYNALFEMYLGPDVADGVDDEGRMQERSRDAKRKSAYDLLQRGWSDEARYLKYRPEHVLMLARMHEWVEG